MAGPEREPIPYQRASHFAGEQPAGAAYFAAERVLYEARQDTDLSVYRLQLNQLWHVAAVGLLPPQPVLQVIEDILDAGEPADLPAEVWQALHKRRARATRLGPWVERHQRPDPRR